MTQRLAGSTTLPIKIYSRIETRLQRLAGEILIGEVFATELTAGHRVAAGRGLPEQAHTGVAPAFAVFDLDPMVTRAQTTQDLAFAEPTPFWIPSVDHQRAIDPDPHRIIKVAFEAVGAGGKWEIPLPANRELVCPYPYDRVAAAPVEVDLVVEPRIHRIAAQVGGGKEAGAELPFRHLRTVGGLLPAQLGDSTTTALEVLHLDAMCARCKRQHGTVFGGPLMAPAIDDQPPIDPHPDTVIPGGDEAVARRLEEKIALPTDREVVLPDPVDRRAPLPVEVDGRVDAPLAGCSGEALVTEELGTETPARHRLAPRHPLPVEVGAGTAPALFVLHPDPMAARRQPIEPVLLAVERPLARPIPAVDDRLAVDPDPHAVVGIADEAVGPRLEGEVALPAQREAVGALAIVRAPLAPVVGDLRLSPAIHRVALQLFVVEQLGAKLAARHRAATGHRLPAEIGPGVAPGLAVLHADLVQPRGETQQAAVFAAVAPIHAPGVDHLAIVDPEPNAVIHITGEAVGATVEVETALPAHREAVGVDPMHRPLPAPVEGDGRRLLLTHRLTLELLVVEVAAAEGAAGHAAARVALLPMELGRGPAAMLLVFDLDPVAASRQMQILEILGGGLGLPGVDDRRIVDPHPHPVIGAGDKAVVALGEGEVPLPAGREVILADHPRQGRLTLPLKINGRHIGGVDRQPSQFAVVEELATEGPVWHRLAALPQLPADVGTGPAAPLPIFDPHPLQPRRQRDHLVDAATVLPGVDEQPITDPDPHPIIGVAVEVVLPRLELELAQPTD
ncbi:hypothetical protein TevJSym_ba00010 [endosymbiont of Tevnia jerichonana (vent Tica)]|uniref:Uncharacterized protein n=1 Tax=endosymbiont of Tevnia jerichonana (vent Tica) TaxID=1049564 RepID=G2FI56_9GAMM|nr:hypothetical protein TevJSym_ba00010 [endosymbiont of Tevnia jerichonana (vent Tica)]